ncbi:hypothetical protein VTI74DRAFT_8851 [Chaetomium olivicolor]
MASRTSTIGQCLSHNPGVPLPDYVNPHGWVAASELGPTTSLIAPPKFAEDVPAIRWIVHAANVVNEIRHHVAMARPPYDPLNDEHVSLEERSVYHGGEADVVRTSGIYLLHPVHQALDALPTVHGTIRVQAEVQSNRLRTDLTYYKSTAASGTYRPFAVIEFKRRGILNPSDFLHAVKAINNSNQTTRDASINKHVNDAKATTGQNTFFVNNSLKGLKQISAYAMNNRTQYCALFDWDALVLVRFLEVDPTKTVADCQRAGIGRYCEMTYIPNRDSHLMRPALLGFLQQAYANTPPV